MSHRVTINIADTPSRQLIVVTPYDRRFRQAAHSLGGQWDERSRTWTFDNARLNDVREACREIFGADDGEIETEEGNR